VITDVVIEPTRDSISLIAGSRLRVIATDSAGNQVNPIITDWLSLDPTVAEVDSAGFVTPRRAGTARIRLSVGGWATAETVIRIGSSRSSVVFRETWRDGIESRFVPFGTPLPRIVQDSSLGAALFNNGDGSFSSGVYTRAPLSAERGLGLEVPVKAPVTRLQWQTLSIGFFRAEDSAQLARWDHHTGSHPSHSNLVGACHFALPAGEGPSWLNRVNIVSRDGSPVDVPPSYFRGVPFSVRVQIFPDGRCALALNGRAVRVVNIDGALAGHYRIIIAGNSVGTRMLVGPVDVWEGVKSDVDWLRTPKPN
jgi:hypothetical protein